jgi:membrane associated rhomboid family serine protease
MGRFKLGRLGANFAEPYRVITPVIAMSLVVTAASGLTFLLQIYGVPARESLGLTPSSPWGIFTMMFVHNGLSHLSGNVAMLWALTALIFLLGFVQFNGRRKRMVLFTITVVGSAVLAHSVWLAITWSAENQVPSVGASGLTYAFSGATLSFALMNSVEAYSKRRIEDHRKKGNAALLVNGLVAGMLLIQIVIAPEVFLNVSEGTNSFGHGIAFLFGFFGIMARESFLPTIRSALIRPKQ